MEQRVTRISTIKKNSPTAQVSELAGRMPPHALDFERSVLGAMLIDRNAVTDIIDILSIDTFFDQRHASIYKAIRDLFGSSQQIDILTVSQQLRKNGEFELVGASYLTSLTLKVASTTDIERHAGVILEKYLLRSLIRSCYDIVNDAYDETQEPLSVLEKAGDRLFNISENLLNKSVDSIANVLQAAITEIEIASQNKDGISGVPSGFFELDKITAGWQPSDMIVIAARPAMGKTAFVLSMARNAAVDHGMGVVIFSLEMSSVQLVKRLIAGETKINAERIRKGEISAEDLTMIHERASKLKKASLHIDDTPGLSVFDLRAKCRRLKMKHNIDMVIIDYLQLMSAGAAKGGFNREQEISTISRSIKGIAKELNVPIIALSQLSRSVEARGGDKKPILSDLRESGAIEQDADIVSFIYRPEYYGLTTDENGESQEGIGEIIIAKHRNGSLGTIRLQFVSEFARFENIHYSGGQFDKIHQQKPQIVYASKMNEDTQDDFIESQSVKDLPF